MKRGKPEHKKHRISQITEIIGFHYIVMREVQKRYDWADERLIQLLCCCDAIIKDYGYFTFFMLSSYTSKTIGNIRNDQSRLTKLNLINPVNERTFFKIRRFELTHEARKVLTYYNRIMINTVESRLVSYSPHSSPFVLSLLELLSLDARDKKAQNERIQQQKLKWRMNREKKAKNNSPDNQ